MTRKQNKIEKETIT